MTATGYAALRSPSHAFRVSNCCFCHRLHTKCPLSACPNRAVSSVITINRVQDVYKNRIYAAETGAHGSVPADVVKLDALYRANPALCFDQSAYARKEYKSVHIGDVFVRGLLSCSQAKHKHKMHFYRAVFLTLVEEGNDLVASMFDEPPDARRLRLASGKCKHIRAIFCARRSSLGRHGAAKLLADIDHVEATLSDKSKAQSKARAEVAALQRKLGHSESERKLLVEKVRVLRQISLEQRRLSNTATSQLQVALEARERLEKELEALRSKMAGARGERGIGAATQSPAAK